MDFISITISALKALATLVGNWGVAIIILTVLIRLVLWPSNVSQQRSMRVMQTLQPKMKAIQDRYKNDPQTMQKKMMEFYKENKFNPMAGCLPLLLQMPVFIMLYAALMSPQFIQAAGHASFLFIDRLDATVKSNAGLSYDGKFQVGAFDTFTAGKTVKLYLKNGEVIDNIKVDKPTKAVTVQGAINPGQPVDLKFAIDNIHAQFSVLDQIQKVEVNIIDNQTRETENVTFIKKGDILAASVPTIEAKSAIHYDVIFLILLFALTMWIVQKVMMAQQKNIKQDPTQEAIQKSMGTVMPVMITVTFFFIPIPAGVLLYLVTSNIFQIAQTIIINKQLENEDEKKKQKNNTKENINLKEGKVIEVKEIKDSDNK